MALSDRWRSEASHSAQKASSYNNTSYNFSTNKQTGFPCKKILRPIGWGQNIICKTPCMHLPKYVKKEQIKMFAMPLIKHFRIISNIAHLRPPAAPTLSLPTCPFKLCSFEFLIPAWFLVRLTTELCNCFQLNACIYKYGKNQFVSSLQPSPQIDTSLACLSPLKLFKTWSMPR